MMLAFFKGKYPTTSAIFRQQEMSDASVLCDSRTLNNIKVQSHAAQRYFNASLRLRKGSRGASVECYNHT